jgi:uncharacterized caspase-like protein
MPDAFAHGYGLVVGVADNAVPRFALPDVAKDIVALRNVLVDPDRCAYPSEQVRMLTGADATRGAILDGLDWLADCTRGDSATESTVVIYFSGHGWRDMSTDPPTYYLIPYDVREDAVRSRALRVDDFAANVRALHARRVLVMLDCCHSGGMQVKSLESAADGYAPSAVPPQLLMPPADAGLSKGLEELSQGSGRAVLSSSQGDQSSWIRRDRRMSIFTYHVIEALLGHGQRGKGLIKGVAPPEPDPAQPPELSRAASVRVVNQADSGVAIGGNVSGSTIITGNHNRVSERRT